MPASQDVASLVYLPIGNKLPWRLGNEYQEHQLDERRNGGLQDGRDLANSRVESRRKVPYVIQAARIEPT